MSDSNFEIVIADPIRSSHELPFDSCIIDKVTRKVLFIHDIDSERNRIHGAPEKDYFKYPTSQLPFKPQFLSKPLKCGDDDCPRPLPHIYCEVSELLWKTVHNIMKPDIVLVNDRRYDDRSLDKEYPINMLYGRSKSGYAIVEGHKGPDNIRHGCGIWHSFITNKGYVNEDTESPESVVERLNKYAPASLSIVLTSDVYSCNTCGYGEYDRESGSIDKLEQKSMCHDKTHSHVWNLSFGVYYLSVM